MPEDSYRQLADHLNRLPGGFPPTANGEELRLLEKLFTPAEAALATHLTLEREEAPAIADRAGISPAEVKRRLDEMAAKGLIFSVNPKEGPVLYQAAPFVVGIYEFQVGRLDEELIGALDAYWKLSEKRPSAPHIPQMRTIPVGQRVDLPPEALPYERVDEIVKTHSRFAVAPCVCRRHAKLQGKGCDGLEESCLLFDEWADYYVSNVEGRYIERAEVMEILAEADAANLVLQPSNSQHASFICCCCRCCCGVLRSLRLQRKPAEVVASPFIARLDAEACEGCRICLDRCPMKALRSAGNRQGSAGNRQGSVGDHVRLKVDRCIGCGLCVTTCPSEALSLERKADGEQAATPADMTTTWQVISRAQAETQ